MRAEVTGRPRPAVRAATGRSPITGHHQHSRQGDPDQDGPPAGATAQQHRPSNPAPSDRRHLGHTHGIRGNEDHRRVGNQGTHHQVPRAAVLTAEAPATAVTLGDGGQYPVATSARLSRRTPGGTAGYLRGLIKPAVTGAAGSE